MKLIACLLFICAAMQAAEPAQGLRSRPRPTPLQPVPDGVKAYRNVEYVPGGHERQKLDLYVPAEGGPHPVIIWIHGGAWMGGSKDHCPALFYAKEGYAVASVGYRLSQHALFPAQIQDCKAAARWLRANAAQYRLDTNHFAAWGESAGGHLSALLGVTGDTKEFDTGPNIEFSSAVQAVCDWYGPTDFAQMQKFPSKVDRTKNDYPEAKLIGGIISENLEKAQKANPIAYVSKNDAPFLIVHGEKDELVPFNQSVLLNEALAKAGVETTFLPIADGNHGGPQWRTPEMKRILTEFLAKHLKPAAKKN